MKLRIYRYRMGRRVRKGRKETKRKIRRETDRRKRIESGKEQGSKF